MSIDFFRRHFASRHAGLFREQRLAFFRRRNAQAEVGQAAQQLVRASPAVAAPTAAPTPVPAVIPAAAAPTAEGLRLFLERRRELMRYRKRGKA